MVDAETTPVLPTVDFVDPDCGLTAADMINITSLETSEQLTAVDANPSNAAVTVESESTRQTAATSVVCDENVVPIKAFYGKRLATNIENADTRLRPKRQRQCPVRYVNETFH